jgi:hypothetical protein
LRRWWLDRNPLRRSSDRAETAVAGLLLAVFLAAAPFVVQATVNWVHATAVSQQARPAAAPAQLVFVAPGGAMAATVPVGDQRAGGAGRQAGAVGQNPQASGSAGVFAGLALAGLAGLLVAAWWLVRRALDRRRLAAWAAEWLLTEPGWSSRR